MKKIRLLQVIFSLTFLFALCIPLKSYAEDNTVRIGWYSASLFQEGMSDGEAKSGYCYKYLQKISNYNGWDYEYVYGDWAELLTMLENGEIDIMAGVSETEERDKYMFFPDYEMGNENYCLYQHESNMTMDPSNPDSFNGQKVGGIRDNRMTYFLEQWIEENNLNLEIVYYDSFDERNEAFADGELDGVVATDNNIPLDTDYSLVASVGKEPYYLAVTKSRPDLLKELNTALYLLEQMDPYFLQNLEYSSYGATLTNVSLSNLEKAWVQNHSTLTMGYMEDYMPYCGNDKEGNITGLIVDVVNASLESLRISDEISVNYKCYKTYDEMVEALQTGEIDAAFPMGGSDWNIEGDNVDVSSSVVTAGMDLVYKGDYEKITTGSFAVYSSKKLQLYFVEQNYPDAKLIYYDNLDECIEAVEKGEADFTVVNGLRADLVRDRAKYDGLSIVQLQKTDARAIGVKHGNTALLLLIDRGLRLIGSDYGTNAAYYYVNADKSETFTGFVHAHVQLVIMVSIGFVIFLTLIFTFYVKGIKKAEKEAEEANKAKTDFLFNMSHDIRTPMNAIMGFTELLKKEDCPREKQQEYIEKIEASSRFLLSLINDVLEMSRIESGNINIEETPLNLDDFNTELFDVFDEQMRQKNITFLKDISIEHRYVYADPVRLKEIFLNILSNAYKYTPEGKRVLLRTREVKSAGEGYACYKIDVSDTGIGMSKEYLPHIFENFSREKNATDSKIEGTGLGMPIVKRLVDAMGGEITVESELGQGSTFTVTLTLRIAEEKYVNKEETTSTVTQDFKGRRILLAEDNDFNAEIATEILEDAGFLIERAEDGAICVDMLEKADAGYYDLILMDIQMPNLNGYDATRKIRSFDDTVKASIPIIAMTANAFEEDKTNSLNAGMNAHLGKPIEIPKLYKALSKAIKDKAVK